MARTPFEELAELKARLNDGDLDESIHELFAAKAADVNNGAINEQVDTLVKEYGVGDTIKLIRNILE